MKAHQVFAQNDGEVTKAYYSEMNARGPAGQLAVALFRAQKRSSAAKKYRGGKYRRAAYDVKSWSLSEVSRILSAHGTELGVTWGWKEDSNTVFGDEPSHVLYVDLPGIGQCSFHTPTRGTGPAYQGEWSGKRDSAENILAFCNSVEACAVA